MSGKTGKIILGLVGFAFLIAGAGVGVYLVQQQQLIKKDAVVPGGTADILLSPQSANANSGDTIPVDIRVNSHDIAVSTLNVRLMFPNDGILNYPVSIVPNQTLIQDHQWRFDTNSYVNGDNVIIDISAFNTSIEGYTANGDVTYATIQLVGNNTGTASLQFDPANTVLLEKSTGNDILSDQLPSPGGTYTIGGGGPAPSMTPSPTQDPGPLPSASPSPTTGTNPPDSPTPSPTTGSVPANTPTPTTGSSGNNNGVCNLACTSNDNCAGGLVCESGQCRNNSCRGENDCDCTSISNATSISISSPVSGAQLTDTTPTFTGSAASGARIQVTVNSTGTITGTTTANTSGAWTFTVPSSTPLALGSHTATFVAYDAQNRQTTASVAFTIVAAGSSGTSSTTTTTTPTDTTLPQAGSAELTILLTALGILFLLTGSFLAFKRRP